MNIPSRSNRLTRIYADHMMVRRGNIADEEVAPIVEIFLGGDVLSNLVVQPMYDPASGPYLEGMWIWPGSTRRSRRIIVSPTDRYVFDSQGCLCLEEPDPAGAGVKLTMFGSEYHIYDSGSNYALRRVPPSNGVNDWREYKEVAGGLSEMDFIKWLADLMIDRLQPLP